MGEGRRANPWKGLLAGCYTDLSPNAPHGPQRPKLAARLFPIPMLLTAPSQRKRIRWTSTIKGTSTGSFLLVGLRSCVARPARSRRIKRRSSSWSSTPSGNYLKQSWPTTRTAQARWHHGRILLAEHDMIPVSCDPSRQESATGDCPAQHFMLVMALAHSVASWCPSWDGLRRLSRRMVGAQESANQEHGAWFLGSWAQLRGRGSPHSCPQPLHPSPPKPGEGARDEEAEGKGDRERENLEGGRLGTPAASSSPWQSSPSF